MAYDTWYGFKDHCSNQRVLQERIDNFVIPDRNILVMCLLYSNSVLSSGTFQPTITPASQQNEK